MLHIQVFDPPPRCLLPMALRLADLCKAGSEMQELFRSITSQQTLRPTAYSMHIAVAYVLDEEGSLEPWGWSALTMWDGKLCLQQFVAKEKRRRHLATALTTALFIDRGCPESLCVFSTASARIATRLGVADVRLFKRVADGWLRSDYEDSARRDEPE